MKDKIVFLLSRFADVIRAFWAKLFVILVELLHRMGTWADFRG